MGGGRRGSLSLSLSLGRDAPYVLSFVCIHVGMSYSSVDYNCTVRQRLGSARAVLFSSVGRARHARSTTSSCCRYSRHLFLLCSQCCCRDYHTYIAGGYFFALACVFFVSVPSLGRFFALFLVHAICCCFLCVSFWLYVVVLCFCVFRGSLGV